MTNVNLPAIIGATTPALQALTDALGVPRTIIASDDEINTAWNNLPRVMNKIPPALRGAGLVRMCVAVSAGLFDQASKGQVKDTQVNLDSPQSLARLDI